MGDSKGSPRRALYRTYRSRVFDDVVGQDHVTATLKLAVKTGRTVHAYLFTGPHGVGKTSVARILAHELNQLPYDGQVNHLDVVEIDAASNRGIDEVRELREKAFVAPSSAKYKVYIIDEVHMLTTPAFNALLKLLEEPPAHVVFILATTEAHKVPATIRSRAQWFAFGPIAVEKVVAHLKQIARNEQITIDDTALELVAAHGRGSLRDSIGLMEQLASHAQEINGMSVASLLGLAPLEGVKNILNLVSAGNWQDLRSQLNELVEKGVNAKQLSQQLIDSINRQTPTHNNLILVDGLLGVMLSHDPQLTLEVVLTKQALLNQPLTAVDQPTSARIESATRKTQALPSVTSEGLKPEHWQSILADVKARNNSLYAVLRLAQPSLTDNRLTLSFGFEFHKQRLAEDHNRQTVADIASGQLGISISVSSVLDKSLTERVVETSADATMSQVKQVMGGGVSMDYEEPSRG